MNRVHALFLTVSVALTAAFSGCSAPGDLLPVTAKTAGFVPNHEGPIRVACVGDSITFGYGLDDPATMSYPAVLQTKLGGGYEVRNFGSSGATAYREPADAAYHLRPVYGPSIAFEPDIVVVMLGTNDTQGQYWKGQPAFVEDYLALIRSYQNLPTHPKIIVGVPPTQFRGVGELSGGIRRTAEAVDGEIVDLFSSVSNRLLDGIHPNAEGHALMASRVAAVIR